MFLHYPDPYHYLPYPSSHPIMTQECHLGKGDICSTSVRKGKSYLYIAELRVESGDTALADQ